MKSGEVSRGLDARSIRQKLRSHPNTPVSAPRAPAQPVVARRRPSELELDSSKAKECECCDIAALTGHQEQVVRSKRRSPLRPPPPPSSRHSSPARSRSVSPARGNPALAPLLTPAQQYQRIEKAKNARLYLLQRPGPRRFVVGADDIKRRSTVVISTQPSCSCGRPSCVHLLFVWTRVFKLAADDRRLFARHLTNYEVEELLVRDRRASPSRSNMRSPSPGVCGPHTEKGPPSGLSNVECDTRAPCAVSGEDDASCPICLLPMMEEEQLVSCTEGCRNRIHQHCINIWEKACVDMAGRYSCPLCRNLRFPETVSAAAAASSGNSSPEPDGADQLAFLSNELNADVVYGVLSQDGDLQKVAFATLSRHFSGVTCRDHVITLLKGLFDRASKTQDLISIGRILKFISGVLEGDEQCTNGTSGKSLLKDIIHFCSRRSRRDSHRMLLTTCSESELMTTEVLGTLGSLMEDDTALLDTDMILELVSQTARLSDSCWPEMSQRFLKPLMSCIPTAARPFEEVLSRVMKDNVEDDGRFEDMRKLTEDTELPLKYCQKLMRLRRDSEAKKRLIRGLSQEKSPPMSSPHICEAQSRSPQMKTQVATHYEVIIEKLKGSYLEGEDWSKGECIGSGGYSSCFLARDNLTGSTMAVKRVNCQGCSAAEREKLVNEVNHEARLLMSLKHDSIVRVLGTAMSGNSLEIFQEWMPGGNMTHHLKSFGRLTGAHLRSLIRQTSEAVAYIHCRGIVHRDIKGDNLLLDSTGQRVKLCDFGFAAVLTSKTTCPGEFENQLVGTVCFMAPEVIRGDQYGRSCDVWSLGCVILQMATASLPWGASHTSNKAAIMYKIGTALKPPEIPSHLPAGLRELAAGCLKIDPSLRLKCTQLLEHPYLKP